MIWSSIGETGSPPLKSATFGASPRAASNPLGVLVGPRAAAGDAIPGECCFPAIYFVPNIFFLCPRQMGLTNQ